VEFNKEQTIAKVHYRLLYQGGEALYFKINEKWILQNAGLTWQE
jgi:hypothetical protein